MKALARTGAAVVLGALSGVLALAQAKEIPGGRVTETGTGEAIDHKARVLTLKDETGALITVDVPAGVARFDQVRVGDKVTATVNADALGLTPTPGAKPAGTVTAPRTMTAIIEAIDPNVPSITFAGLNGWKYGRQIQDKKVLKQIKVGDRVDFTWTEAVQISFEPGQ